MRSNYLINKKFDAEYRGQVWSPPANRYAAILVANKGLRSLLNSQAVLLNDLVCHIAADSKMHLYRVTTAGTLAGSPPGGYAGTPNEVVNDGTAVLTEQDSALRAGSASAIVEPTGGGYARVAVPANMTASGWAGTQGAGTTVASSGAASGATPKLTISNNASITWPAPTGNWCSAPAAWWGTAFFDAATVGNVLEICPNAAQKYVASGDQAPLIAAGALTLDEN